MSPDALPIATESVTGRGRIDTGSRSATLSAVNPSLPTRPATRPRTALPLRAVASRALSVVATATWVACVGPPPPESAATESVAAARYGLVTLAAPSGRTSGLTESGVETDVHFFGYAGVARQTVVAALDAWEPAETDGCLVLEPPAAAATNATIDLFSAGVVGVSGNGGSTTFEPRFLGTGPRLAGFTYAATERADAPVWAAHEPYTFWTSGDDIGAFSLDVQAPPAVYLVSVSGRELGSATETRVGAGEDLEIELFTEAESVYVSLRTLRPFGAPTAECRFGSAARVRFDAVELDDAFGPGADIEVIVRTANTEPLPEGIGTRGLLLATAYDRVTVRR